CSCHLSFFFQAEDGIRDFHVTGVQTCALPIWNPWSRAPQTAPCKFWARGYSQRSTPKVLTYRQEVLMRGTLAILMLLIALDLQAENRLAPPPEAGLWRSESRLITDNEGSLRRMRSVQPGLTFSHVEIGRASCRDRTELSRAVGAG